ncbi:MAG TPA: hypothetical protein VEZ11_10890 [Thermoanaerobaculia bacterium]|nr:hypothetical protein [Thermoanaerobaculia bacterium]
MSPGVSLPKRIVNLVMLSASLGGIIIAMAIFYWTSFDFWWKPHTEIQAVLCEIGRLIFVTSLLSIVWELIAKRALVDEILARVRTAQEIASAGLVDIAASFHDGIDWSHHFSAVKEIDIFFAYGRTWLGTHLEQLRSAIGAGASIRVVLPDPEDRELTAELARRFGYARDDLVSLIRQSDESFKSLAKDAGTSGRVQIWHLTRTPVFSYYRFDRTAIFAIYHHRSERSTAPAFTFEEPGSLFSFFKREFELMISDDNPATRKFFSTRT